MTPVNSSVVKLPFLAHQRHGLRAAARLRERPVLRVGFVERLLPEAVEPGVWPPAPQSAPPPFGQPLSPPAAEPPPRKTLGGDDL